MGTSNLACEQATPNCVEERQILMRTPVTCKSSLKLQSTVISDRLFSPVPVRYIDCRDLVQLKVVCYYCYS